MQCKMIDEREILIFFLLFDDDDDVIIIIIIIDLCINLFEAAN